MAVYSEHLDPSICRYKKAFRPVELLTAIVRSLLIRMVGVPARRQILVYLLTIYRGYVLDFSVTVRLASTLALVQLTLPHPSRPLKSAEMPSGECSTISSRGIVLGVDEDIILVAATGEKLASKVIKHNSSSSGAPSKQNT